MKIFTNIFLWLVMIYHGAVCLGALLLFWGPLYLAITNGDRFDWFLFFGTFCSSLSAFVIALILYRNIRSHHIVIAKKQNIILLVLFILHIGLSLTFIPELFIIHIIVAALLGALILTYPKIVKGYY